MQVLELAQSHGFFIQIKNGCISIKSCCGDIKCEHFEDLTTAFPVICFEACGEPLFYRLARVEQEVLNAVDAMKNSEKISGIYM